MTTVYVSSSGTDDYTVDGVADDVQINLALAYANTYGTSSSPVTVYLRGPYTYQISSWLLCGSNTILTGDYSAKLRLKNSAGWDNIYSIGGVLDPDEHVESGCGTQAIIKQLVSPVSNVYVHSFEIDGNSANQTGYSLGRMNYVLMYFNYCSNIRMENMYIHDGCSDGMRMDHGTGLYFRDNTVHRMGHDGNYFLRSSVFEISGNTTLIRTNSAHRVMNTGYGSIHDNVMKPYALTSISGNPGIQIEHGDVAYSMKNIEVYGNTLTDCWGEGFWILEYGTAGQESDKNLYIHDNTITGAGPITTIDYNAGITITGWNNARISNNVIKNCYNAGILVGGAPSQVCKIFCTNNTITGTKKTLATATKNIKAWSGYGVVNNYSSSYTMSMSGNVVSGNYAGNYYGFDGSFNGSYTGPTDNYTPPGDVVTTPPTVVQAVIRIDPDDDIITEYIPGWYTYVNGFAISVLAYDVDVDTSLSTDKPPGMDGWVLGHFGKEGASLGITCSERGKTNLRRALAAWYRSGRSYLELGGSDPETQGWQVSGLVRNHTTKINPAEGDRYAEDDEHLYKINFYADTPFEESCQRHIRARTVSQTGDQWSSDNCYPGQVMRNGSFESCTLNELGEVTAIDGWDISAAGGRIAISTEVATDGLYSLIINGDEATEEPGMITQPIMIESGVTYILTAFALVEAEQTGSLSIEICSGGQVLAELKIWNFSTEWVAKETTIKLDPVPPDLTLRVHGSDTPNTYNMYVDKIGLRPYNVFETFATGAGLITNGTVETIPDVCVEAQGVLSGSGGAGGESIGATIPYTNSSSTGSTTITSYQHQDFLDHTFAAKTGVKLRVDLVSIGASVASSGGTCTAKIEVYFNTTLAGTYEGPSTSYPADNYTTKSWNPSITSAEGQSVTVKYYLKSASSIRAYIKTAKATVTEVTGVAATAVASVGMELFNIVDPLTRMKLCNKIYPGIKKWINADGTGSIRYSCNFEDATYQSVTSSHTGDTYSASLKQTSFTGHLDWPIDCLNPVTGIPYLKVYVVSGTPKLQISLDNVTWYDCIDNDSVAVTNAWIIRELDATNLRLYGKTSFYFRIMPASGTLVISSVYMFSFLITIDAVHPVIYPTGVAETFEVYMTADVPATITLRYPDRHIVS